MVLKRKSPRQPSYELGGSSGADMVDTHTITYEAHMKEKQAIKIILNDDISHEDQYDQLMDLGYDLEDIIELVLKVHSGVLKC
jgi:hypothetical protein